MRKRRDLSDLYRFSGFKPKKIVSGIFGDSRTRVIKLVRRGKKLFAAHAALPAGPGMTARYDWSVIFPAATRGFVLSWNYDASNAGDVTR